jgi:RNA polymerase sigma-70 factor (ECF subfamily)
MSADSQTRATLLERVQNGADRIAWDEFVGRYWPLIFTAARRRGCSEHTAEEIVQDVMLAVFENKAVFCYDPARGRFRDWLGAVVRNKVAERRRKLNGQARARGGDGADPEPVASDVEPDAAWEAAFEQATLAFLLDVVRRETSPRTYQAFELSSLGRLSGAEVARVTGLSRNAVYQAQKKVLRRLRELGATYRDRGPPNDCLRAALESRPNAAVERSLRTRMDESGKPKAESGELIAES